MKWKDSGEMTSKEEKPKEEYFDEEQYSPWADGKDTSKAGLPRKMTLLLALLVAAIVALVAILLMVVMGGGDQTTSSAQVRKLEGKVQALEERLDKYEAIDEKVTRIWEQAKSFEKFKDRFDRSEASMSLRMDHLTMSLESLQKQFNESRKTPPASAANGPSDSEAAPDGKPTVQYHQVARGETFYSISKRYNLKVADLLKMNQLNNDSVLKPGQKLVVRNVD